MMSSRDFLDESWKLIRPRRPSRPRCRTCRAARRGLRRGREGGGASSSCRVGVSWRFAFVLRSMGAAGKTKPAGRWDPRAFSVKEDLLLLRDGLLGRSLLRGGLLRGGLLRRSLLRRGLLGRGLLRRSLLGGGLLGGLLGGHFLFLCFVARRRFVCQRFSDFLAFLSGFPKTSAWGGWNARDVQVRRSGMPFTIFRNVCPQKNATFEKKVLNAPTGPESAENRGRSEKALGRKREKSARCATGFGTLRKAQFRLSSSASFRIIRAVRHNCGRPRPSGPPAGHGERRQTT